MKLSIFFLLCLAIVNAPHVKGQTIPGQESLIHAKQQKVKQIYTSQIGIREKHSNSGAEVEKYLHYVNLPAGNPWCAAFVCWVFGQASIENPRTGWSPDLFKPNRIIWERRNTRSYDKSNFKQNNTNTSPPSLNAQPIHPALTTQSIHQSLNAQHIRPARQLITDNRQPASGDIFGIFFPNKNRIAHVGFIDQWQTDWVITVEGNTNIEGSREGDGVYRKRRPVKSIYQVARYIRQP